MIWHKESLDTEKVRELVSRYKLSPLEASLLFRRKLTAEADLAFFLEDNLSFSHNPFLFHDMTSVVERLFMAKEEGEKALIFGDKDVDGMTSTAIASHMLRHLGIEHTSRIPTGEELYGLTPIVVDEASENEVTLIITVDCGISAYDAINRAKELGIDVLVFDHHLAQTTPLVPATAIINPNIEGSGYPFPYLAGCGVVTKIFWAILYAGTPLYNVDFCFISTAGEKLYLVHSLNGLVESSLTLAFDSPDILDKFANFATGKILITLSAKETERELQKRLGNGFLVEMQDLGSVLERHMPPLVGKTLDEIQTFSRKMLYNQENLDEDGGRLAFMGFFFAEILILPYKEAFAPYESILDLTALGTLADMMPLQNENRILVKRGLRQLSQTQHKGLQALISLKNLQGRSLKAYNASWEITPMLNSAGRMGEAWKSLDLLLVDDMDDGFVKAREIMSLNRRRKSLETKIWDNSGDEVQQSYWDYNRKMVLLFRDDIPKGLTGILANRMMRAHHTPAIVLSRQNDIIKGSLRAPEGFSAKDFLAQIKDCLEDFGGHNSVAGFSLREEHLDKLLSKFKSFALSDELALKRPPLTIDAFLPMTSFNPSILDVVNRFEPFGKGYEDFIFEVHGVFLENFNFIGDSTKNHSVMLSVRGASHRFPSIFWNGYPILEKLDLINRVQTAVNIVFKFQESFYKGQVSQRLSILDVKIPESAPLQKD